MIKYVIGDLLEAEEDVLVHQVNCQGKMKSGIADQIRKKWSVVYDSYYNMLLGKGLFGNPILLGKVQMVEIEEGKYVANLFSQLDYGYDGKRYTSYDSFYDGLLKIKYKAKENNLSVALPYNIGSDRGGANWNIIKTMIEEIFDDYSVTLYKFEETKK